MTDRAARKVTKRYCRLGHLKEGDNLIMGPDGPLCRICTNRRVREWLRKKRGTVKKTCPHCGGEL